MAIPWKKVMVHSDLSKSISRKLRKTLKKVIRLASKGEFVVYKELVAGLRKS